MVGPIQKLKELAKPGHKQGHATEAGLGAQEGHLAHEAHRHHEPLAGAATTGMTGAAGPGMAGVSGGEMPLGGVEGVEGARGMGMGGTSGGMGEAGMGGMGAMGGMGGMGAAPVEMATERTTERMAERGAATGAGGGLEGGLTGERAPVMGEETVCGRQVFTQTEDRPVLKERIERVVEHRPVEKEFVTETRYVGERPLASAAGETSLGVTERVVEAAAPGPTCPMPGAPIVGPGGETVGRVEDTGLGGEGRAMHATGHGHHGQRATGHTARDERTL